MPAATAREAPAYVRRTSLGANEYHTNFRKLDCETISRLTSPEATHVTSQMCKVYLALINAPAGRWERDGVLRFAGEEREGGWVTAWEQLVSLVGVASATARKALRWMHEQGIVGYFAGKNGVGIRVFMNRAASSVGLRPTDSQKNLRLVRTSTEAPHTSAGDTPFNDSYAVSEGLETDLNPRAPKDGAETSSVGKTSSTGNRSPTFAANTPTRCEESDQEEVRQTSGAVPVVEIVERLKAELEPCVKEAAASAASRSATREMERTREWFETKALPKAVRVAQRETYDLLRRHGALEGRGGRGSAGLEVGRGSGGQTAAAARPLSDEEIRETAEVCVALLEAQGKLIEVTLSEISSEGGGWLLPEDVPRVRELATALAFGGGTARPRAGDRV
jgi:hypothetical protein